MKSTKIYLPLIAAGLLMSACDDQVMEWRESDPTVKPTEIPLKLAETLSRYDYLKNYMAEYRPDARIFLGMGLDDFLASPEYRQVVLDNYQGVTFGNAMKHGSLVKANGSIDWTKVDQFLAMNTGLDIYGHNLIWHTQQNQSYLKSLIEPAMELVGDPDADRVCDNIIVNGDFEKGETSPCIGWSNHTASVSQPGHDSDYCMRLDVSAESTANWKDQRFWDVTVLTPGETYAYEYWARTETPGTKIQFLYQNPDNTGSQQGYGADNELTSAWMRYTGEFTCPDDFDGITRVGLQFGGQEATLYVDGFQFGKKVDAPAKPADPDLLRPNLLANGTFDANRDGWSMWNGGSEGCTVDWDAEEGLFAPGCLKIVNVLTEPSNQYKCQIHADFTQPVEAGATYYISYYIRTAEGAGSVRFSTTGSAHYQGDQTVTPAWTRIEWEITASGEQTGLCIDIAAAPNTYYIDNIVVSTTPFSTPEAQARSAARGSRAQSIKYVLKSAEEKKALLLDAMERWIKECMEHMGTNVSAWDVINEPIGDDISFRGIDGGWMSNSDDENPVPDSAPVETEEDGLKLNWRSASGNQHFYWGYFCGFDYAVKAFEYARKYAPAGTKLFVNDYNLETSPRKLAKLIEFVNKIEQGGATVDGIGTQMHVSMSITKEQVDEMFRTMVATGKLVRITELDIKIGSASPSAEQLAQQSECYRMIINSYFENVPVAQQSAVTMWTLSDNADEHKYWIPDDAPNIFDAKYGRKHAYKGVCDAIAGRDLSEEFESPDYSKH